MAPSWLLIVCGAALVLVILWDAFETIVLPRSVMRRFRLSRVLNSVIWPTWSRFVSGVRMDGRRERYLGFYGPLSVISMIGIWAIGLVLGFALVAHGLGSAWDVPQARRTFGNDVYVSGTTLFTLGLGDVAPVSNRMRALVVVEAGMGLGFLAIGVAYLPVLYQSFSRREAQITLLDAWAGSPPSAVELLRRLASAHELRVIDGFLRDWERWCAEVLEGHISYPQVAYSRSQHGRQSWVAALTTVLDVSALVLAGLEDLPAWQARMTFAIARHTAVDLSQVLNAPPQLTGRIDAETCESVIDQLQRSGIRFDRDPDAARRLQRYRRLYEPYVAGLATALAMPLPPWVRDGNAGHDNWEATPKRDREAMHL